MDTTKIFSRAAELAKEWGIRDGGEIAKSLLDDPEFVEYGGEAGTPTIHLNIPTPMLVQMATAAVSKAAKEQGFTGKQFVEATPKDDPLIKAAIEGVMETYGKTYTDTCFKIVEDYGKEHDWPNPDGDGQIH